jgi:hypothetical protein
MNIPQRLVLRLLKWVLPRGRRWYEIQFSA